MRYAIFVNGFLRRMYSSKDYALARAALGMVRYQHPDASAYLWDFFRREKVDA